MLFRLSVPRRWRQTDRLPVRAFQICFGLSRCLGLWRALETRKRREEKKEMDGRGDAVAVAGAGSRSVAMWEYVLFTNARRYTTHIRKYARRDAQYARMRIHTLGRAYTYRYTQTMHTQTDTLTLEPLRFHIDTLRTILQIKIELPRKKAFPEYMNSDDGEQNFITGEARQDRKPV